MSTQTYYYLAASQKFLLEEEPLDEVLRERTRYYQEQEKALDFWLVKSPAFLDAPELAAVKARCPQPAAAVISTEKTLITWLKLRIEFVITGEFTAPSDSIPEPLASLETVAS
ncbi:MgPME-cyclase complex family protein [Leptolyngbya sp. PCC 6406]|uniref:MgPME-cyclase complex family protein n=1 Tax=Leptolyngbya sp. PCC 6406 TaxID=1173264 RepID=UPI0002AC92F5|nr:MgPME-cyclase complex family protein [Leptolyngbya sp. PCC 6406]